MARRRKKRNKITLSQIGTVAAGLVLLLAAANPTSTISTVAIVLLTVVVVYSLRASLSRGIQLLERTRSESRQFKIAQRAYLTQGYKFLSPREFEHYVAAIFRKFGCDAEVTPESNDHGIDIILDFHGISIGVQVKKWEGSVGRPDLQRLVGAGKKYDRVMCVTNSYYARTALEYAAEHNILLVDGLKLESLGRSAFGVDHINKTLSMKIMGSFLHN